MKKLVISFIFFLWMFSIHAQKNHQPEYFVRNGDTILTKAQFVQRPYKYYELKAQAINGESFIVKDMLEDGITAFKINTQTFELLSPDQTGEKHPEYYNKLISGKLSIYVDNFSRDPGMFDKYSKLENRGKFIKIGDQALIPIGNDGDMDNLFETILQHCPTFQANNNKKIKEENLAEIVKIYNYYCN